MTIERKPAKPKKCRVATCRASFVPSRMGQAVCSPACAMIDAPRHEPKARKALADIERKDIKNLHLGIDPPAGRVRVAAPLALSDDAVRLAVIGRLDWIRRQQAKFQAQPRQSAREMVPG